MKISLNGPVPCVDKRLQSHNSISNFCNRKVAIDCAYNTAMKEMLAQLHALLLDVILPHLKGVQASQAEQRIQTDLLNRNLEEFQSEMQLRFAEIRAEIAACRQEVEDTMVTLREADRIDDTESTVTNKKRLIH